MVRPLERARVLTSTLFKTLFPAKEAKKREAWLKILLAEEFESLDDLAALDDSGWNSVALPLAIKTELRTASARSTPNSTQLAPDSHATLRDPSWGVRESAADGSTGVGPISFNVANELGRGRFGFVFLCTLSDRPGQYAVKRVDRLRFETEGGKKEIDVLLHAQATDDEGHPNVIRYHLMEANEHAVYIVMGLCDESLEERVQRRGLECWEARKATCSQLCAGLAYLHTLPQPIAHRDLKPSNLLFKGNCLKMYACIHASMCGCVFACTDVWQS
jgi:serine/threonine protein kinase